MTNFAQNIIITMATASEKVFFFLMRNPSYTEIISGFTKHHKKEPYNYSFHLRWIKSKLFNYTNQNNLLLWFSHVDNLDGNVKSRLKSWVTSPGTWWWHTSHNTGGAPELHLRADLTKQPEWHSGWGKKQSMRSLSFLPPRHKALRPWAKPNHSARKSI